MVRRHRDSGSSSIGDLLVVIVLIAFVCAVYLMMDVRHRLDGYEAVRGKGTDGTATVTHCESGRWGPYCVGDFASVDGRIVRKDVRVNGAVALLKWNGGRLAAPVRLPATIAKPGADDVWTLEGAPWMRFSKAQLFALAPIALLVMLVRSVGLLDLGDYRERAHRRMVRRGRVS